MRPEDKNLEALLQSRNTPIAPENLSQRIINAAQHIPQQKALLTNIKQWLNSFEDILIIPRPAMALPVCLILGIGIGIFIDSTFWLPDVKDTDFMIINDIILYDETYL